MRPTRGWLPTEPMSLRCWCASMSIGQRGARPAPPRRPTGTVSTHPVGFRMGGNRAILERALAQGHEVTAVDRDPARLRVEHHNLRVLQADIFDPLSVRTLRTPKRCCPRSAPTGVRTA